MRIEYGEPKEAIIWQTVDTARGTVMFTTSETVGCTKEHTQGQKPVITIGNRPPRHAAVVAERAPALARTPSPEFNKKIMEVMTGFRGWPQFEPAQTVAVERDFEVVIAAVKERAETDNFSATEAESICALYEMRDQARFGRAGRVVIPYAGSETGPYEVVIDIPVINQTMANLPA